MAFHPRDTAVSSIPYIRTLKTLDVSSGYHLMQSNPQGEMENDSLTIAPGGCERTYSWFSGSLACCLIALGGIHPARAQTINIDGVVRSLSLYFAIRTVCPQFYPIDPLVARNWEQMNLDVGTKIAGAEKFRALINAELVRRNKEVKVTGPAQWCATDVAIPVDVFSTLVRTGTIKESDIIGKQTYALADGSTSDSITFLIRLLKIGSKAVENVRGAIGPAKGSLLLGQSFLGRFRSWSIDNKTNELLLKE
jgi:hypothetical protein